MLSSVARKPLDLSESQQITRNTGKLASKKIWLPKLLYDSLPYFYLTAGFAAFFATLYISEWFWVLPHYLLFSAACFHLGFVVYRRRRHGAAAAQSN
ncbi:MAG: hypothetical protein IID57_05020 [Proteobacteria bacterium]|nr:hypothetical protein [Pseudomonadota bacterium]